MTRSDSPAAAHAARALLEECGLRAGDLSDEEALDRAATVLAAAGRYRASGANGDSAAEPAPARPDLGAVFDEHIADEFVALDVDATMETMTADPHLDHVPVMTGGVGRDEVRSSYADHFIGKWPADTKITTVSRTVGERQVVEEMVMSFTHDVTMDARFLGVAPTGRPVELPVVVVMGFEGDRVSHEHIYWDQAPPSSRWASCGSRGPPGHRRGAGAQAARQAAADQRADGCRRGLLAGASRASRAGSPGSTAPRPRRPAVEIPKQQILDLLRKRGQDDKASQADQELPDQVDPGKHADVLQRLGIDPSELLGGLGGKLPGGLGDKLGL